ncbi:MAG: GNAT family N-acetyltransferase [Actinomycetaceae bacterium]|nr:GNAT family N-acetyltransferase [Actinomycetaceae bacterium]
MTEPHVFVRAATALDAPAIGDVQARTMRASLTAAVGQKLASDVAERIDAEAFARQWATTIVSPPHRVLVAVEDGEVVGFAALSPTDAPVRPTDEPPPSEADAGAEGETNGGAADEGAGGAAGHTGSRAAAKDGGLPAASVKRIEVTALEVPARHQRHGHGSRLLAAAIDTSRQLGAERIQTWALDGDDARVKFLASAGFGPAGIGRRLQVGDDIVTERCWHARL